MKQIFRTLTYFVAAFVAVATINSCAKEKEYLEEGNALDPGVERNINTSAGLPQNNDKAFLDGYKVKWNEGDKLNINGVSLTAATIENNVDNPRATFYGTVYAKQDASNNNDVYWAVYPSTLAGAYNGGIPAEFAVSTFTYTLPAIQYDTIGLTRRSMQNRTYMAGRTSVPNGTEHLSFQMRNLGAVMKLHLTAAAGVSETRVEKIVFSSTSNHLAGKFTVDDDANITQGEGTGCLTVYLSDGINPYIDIASGADVYAFLPPVSENGNLSMRIYNVAGDLTLKYNLDAKVERSYLYTNNITINSFSAPSPSFTVSASNKVVFAPGNLRYVANNNTWQFARKQYVYVGNVPGNTTPIANRSTQADTIDLFGWGTSGYDGKYPYLATRSNSDYLGGTNDIDGTNYDWGVYNNIYNPKTGRTDDKGTWRTIISDELTYVLYTRKTPSGILYAKAVVNGVNGMFILPDSWCECTYTINNPNDRFSSFSSNTISLSDWNNILEPAGVVFLPISDYRDGTNVRDLHNYAAYWTSTHSGNEGGVYLYFGAGNDITGRTELRVMANADRYNGYCVRLVKNYVE